MNNSNSRVGNLAWSTVSILLGGVFILPANAQSFQPSESGVPICKYEQGTYEVLKDSYSDGVNIACWFQASYSKDKNQVRVLESFITQDQRTMWGSFASLSVIYDRKAKTTYLHMGQGSARVSVGGETLTMAESQTEYRNGLLKFSLDSLIR